MGQVIPPRMGKGDLRDWQPNKQAASQRALRKEHQGCRDLIIKGVPQNEEKGKEEMNRMAYGVVNKRRHASNKLCRSARHKGRNCTQKTVY